MNRIASGKASVAENDAFGLLGHGVVNGQHFVDDTEKHVECRLDCVAPVYCRVAMQNLLQDFGVGHESAPIASKAFQ